MTNIREKTRRLYEAIDRQNWEVLTGLVSPNFATQVGGHRPVDFSEWRDMLKSFFVGFPDGHHVIDEYVVEDNRAVVTRCRFEGTHTGTFWDVTPSGNKVSVGVIHIDHFVDGKLVEHFGQLDALGLMQQIGAMASR